MDGVTFTKFFSSSKQNTQYYQPQISLLNPHLILVSSNVINEFIVEDRKSHLIALFLLRLGETVETTGLDSGLAERQGHQYISGLPLGLLPVGLYRATYTS